MSRTFWMAVGAVGGIVAYRRVTRAVERARELGPLGTAQVAAQATSTVAGHAAHGLGRLKDMSDRRAGRLVVGSAHGPTAEPAAASPRVPLEVPHDWVPVGVAAGGGRHGTEGGA